MRTAVALLTLVLTATAASAADPITLRLEDFKFTQNDNEPADTGVVGYNESDEKIFFYAPGTATAVVRAEKAGEYTLTIDASCDEAMDVKAEMSVKLGDKVIEKAFKLKETDRKEYEFKVKLPAGKTDLAIAFTNDAFKEGEYDRNLYLHAVKLTPVK